MEQPQRVVVVGQGYVGLPLAMRAVEVGHDVVGFDVDERPGQAARRRRVLRRGHRRRASCAAALATGRYRAGHRPADLRRLRRRGHHRADAAARGHPRPHLHRGRRPRTLAALPAARAPASILESTTYPGTTEELVGAAPGGGLRPDRRRRLPPRLQPRADRPGQPRPGAWSTRPRSSPASTRPRWRAVAGVLRPARRARPCRSPAPKEAELTKLLENTFRHVNIALVNELAMFAHDLGIDVWEAIDAASTKPFGFMRFTPGPGRRRPLPADRPVATCRGG